jgi:TRAP-type mannitol/chloroaromatic compound transport system substrate-binding protein
MTALDTNGWIYAGGGLDLWRELYSQFDLIPAPAGNTGVQMGGWFNREIKSVEDLKGLRMRIPGLGGEVLARAGGIPVNLSGGDLFTAMQNGSIDAAEWAGPYNDLAFGLHKVAKYYYYPGWQEPGTIMEVIINQRAHDGLPSDLQSVVMNACKVANQEMLAEFTARNPVAMQSLITRYGIELRRFPDPVLAKLRTIAEEVLSALAHQDDLASRIYASYRKFQTQSDAWCLIQDLTERLARVPA